MTNEERDELLGATAEAVLMILEIQAIGFKQADLERRYMRLVDAAKAEIVERRLLPKQGL